jgi:hypothetical protein
MIVFDVDPGAMPQAIIETALSALLAGRSANGAIQSKPGASPQEFHRRKMLSAEGATQSPRTPIARDDTTTVCKPPLLGANDAIHFTELKQNQSWRPSLGHRDSKRVIASAVSADSAAAATPLLCASDSACYIALAPENAQTTDSRVVASAVISGLGSCCNAALCAGDSARYNA